MFVYPYTLLFIYFYELISLCQTDVIREREKIVNGTVYSYHTDTVGGAFRSTAQSLLCIDYRGNLATIDSAELDQILYDLAAPNDTECWIGLENTMRGNSWVDGSVSTYRNYPGQTPTNEAQNALFFSLRSSNGTRTDGWKGQADIILYSLICQRPVNIRECEFTNDGSCYRTFQTPYLTNTWYEAQAMCVMWGGNLASITSESENTFLYLRTPNSALNCWIGLTNANVGNEAYYWIDGEVFNYNVWVSGAPNNNPNADDCVRSKVSGVNECNNFNCTNGTDSYICKRSINAQFDPDLGELFGELINGNLGFKELKVNTILYRNITLICGDVINPSTSSTNWIYSQNNDLSTNAAVSSTSFNGDTGVNFISVSNSLQGFYQCRIQKTSGSLSVYTVGVFDLSVTTVAEEGRTYNYTIGIDRTDILLLCVPMNNSIDPINYSWRVGSIVTKNNPILVSILSSSSLNYVCEVFGTDILSISLIVREPRLTVIYNPSVSQTYTQVYPNTIQFSYQGLLQDFTLSSNIEGRWELPDGTYHAGSSVTHTYLLQQYTGLYTFYLYNWDGVEIPAFQINIAAHGSPDRELVYDGAIFAIFSASTNSFSQVAAVDNCISWGGNLASINSQEEDAQLFNLTTGTLFQCWIGLNRHPNPNLIKGPQGYSWEDGSNSLYRKFTSGSPTRRYMKFRPNNGYSSGEGWDDANYDQNTNCYLCRKLANSRGCDFTNDNFCYRTYRNDAGINWDDAQSSCEEWRGNLASVTSEAENLLLFQRTPIIAFDCWSGKYTTVNGITTWNDGNTFSYSRSGNTSPTTGCIQWNYQGGSNWFNTDCSTSTLLNCYICKRIQTIVSIPGVQYETLHTSVFGYFQASWPGVTWNTALQECIGWRGSLASIESAAEDGTLYGLAAGNDTQCWIGLEISTRGHESIIWVDGSDNSYRNYLGQTLTITSIDKYYSLRAMNGSSGGGWNALNMAETLSCFYCEKLANQRGCDFTYDGSCYRTFETNTALNWNDSQSNCMSWGGDLASITSQQENDFLFLRTPFSAINCWIGLTDVNNNGVFQWIDGEQFTYNNWAGGTPNNAVNSDCTQSKIGGMDGWENLECNSVTKCYICKRDVDTSLLTELQRETTYNGSLFSYYTTTAGGLFAGTAQLFFCINRGGNLATIDSAEVDQLLYNLAVADDVECWIGLEKRIRGNETSIWADGSVSTYRNYPGQTPINDEQITEFYSLRARNGNRTSGWEGKNPRETLKCFICQIPVNTRECQFTNDGFCYRTFLLVNPTINWFDAQSNCVMWGGNLASITSEDENTLLFLRTPYRADDCWIGLTSTNTNNEVYYWIDGEMFNYDMWTSGAPNNIANTDDCARNKVAGKNEWNNYNCSNLTDSYICKRSSDAQFNPDLGELFGELINGNLRYKELKVNTLLYRNVTLICGDVINPSTSSTYWIYSQNNDISMNNSVNPTNFASQSGITFISVTNSTQQGFYQCRIQKQNGILSVYTVGVFDLTITTVAEEGRTYNYTIGIDRTDILLLCIPMNNSIDPINYRWRVRSIVTKNNPILVSSLPSSNFNFVCEVFGTDILSISLIVREPRLTVTYNPSVSQTYTQVYPNTIQFSYQGLLQNLLLSSNIEGRWTLPDGIYQAGSSVAYPYLLQKYTGLYTFYLYNWDGVEVPAFQINITTTDNIGIFLSTRSGTGRWEILQNNSLVFLTEQPTTILCVGPRITSSVEWFREDTLLRRSNGSTILDESSIQTPGYFNCRVDEVSTYFIYVADKNILVEITDFTETVNYTLGSPTLIYHNNSVPDNQIRWTTENIETGDDRISNPEYPNPVPLSTIFSNVGGGQYTFTCFYRNSPVTVIGSVDLNLKDTTAVTISYSGFERTFSDVDNIFFPNPQPIEIPSHTSEVVFKCTLTNCSWQINYTNNTQTVLYSQNIAVFQQENEGIYSLLRTTRSGKKYITASVNISTNPEPVTSNVNDAYIIYIGIAAPIILCFSIFIIITVIIIIVCFSKKRRKPKQFASRQFKNEDSDSPSKTNDNLNGHHSKVTKKKNYEKFDEEIVETAFTQSIESTNYQNITTLTQNDENTYEKVPENIRSLSIPLDAYKMHVNELWQNEGSLENDYATLGGQAHRYSCENGTQDPNRVKNRFKLIYPYDKSRVILKETSEEQSSDYINASYIPGLYVKETFIAAQAPKDVTLQSFWQMITENDISNIVMLTNLVESGRIKCEAYFPVKEGKKIIIGPYEIILYKEEILIGYTIRMLNVFYNGKKKQIKQFHFTAWPDHDVPDLHNELLHFVEKVQTQKIDSKSPILVHCSAGVGRSGTFLAIYNLLAAIKQGKAISIYNLVHEMREHRPQMVQTFSQYKFIYLSVLEMLLGSTSIPNDEFTATYKLYMQSESEGYVSVFFQQFSELNYQCDKGFEHTCTTALDDSNKDKNPIKTILPSDKNRAIIFSPHWAGDYINATSIDDNQYIITITPTRNTLGDFLQLLHQFKPSMVVFLVTPKELRLIQDEKSDRVVYWPKQGEPLDANAFTLTSLSSEKFSSMIRNKIRLTHTIENDVSEFTQIISTKWNERGEPELGNVVVLLNAILKQKQKYPGSPIIFHCTDGAGKTGVLFTVFKAILESKEKNFIDIFHIVKKLRNERMSFVSTLNHFVSCFSLMNEYCSNAV